MSTKTVYDEVYDDADTVDYSDDIAEDNINALESHGWQNGKACLLYVHPDGTLGHCNAIDNLPYVLMGSALALLILFHIINTSLRLYRRKSAPTLFYYFLMRAQNMNSPKKFLINPFSYS